MDTQRHTLAPTPPLPGPIEPNFDIQGHAAKTRSPPPAWFAGAMTAGLMAYLEV